MTALATADLRSFMGELLASASITDSAPNGWRILVEVPEGDAPFVAKNGPFMRGATRCSGMLIGRTTITYTMAEMLAWYASSENTNGGRTGKVKVDSALVARGLVERVGARGHKITDAGRAVAKVVEAVAR